MVNLDFKSTKQIKVSGKIIEQVIGQDDAVEVMKKAAEQRRHVLLIGEPGTGKCVGENTTVLLKESPIKAKKLYSLLEKNSIKIEKGDEQYITPTKKLEVYSLDKTGKITENYIIRAYKGKRKKGIKITTKSGCEFVVSGQHPLLTIKDNKLVFMQTDELKEDSYIALARRLPETFNNTIKTTSYSKELLIDKSYIQFIGKNNVRSLKLKLPDKINKQIAYFLGICAAEGRWQGNLVIYNSNKKIKNKIASILKNEFDYPEEFIVVFDKGIFLKKSRTLMYILEKYFDFPLNPKKQSANKKVPSIIFNSTTDVTQSFLSGLIDGDGHIGKRGFEITSASKELIEGVKILLLKLDILSRTYISKKYASNTINKKQNNYSRLCIYDSRNINKLSKNLSLIINYKKEGFEKFHKIKQNTNVDIIPGIGKSLYKLKNIIGVTYDELEQYHATFHKFISGKRNISRDLANEIFTKLKHKSDIAYNDLVLTIHPELQNLIPSTGMIINSDIFWDKIKKMELVEENMYDFEVNNSHNFLISSGVVVHNSMLGIGLAELLPKEKLVDIVSFPNPNDENTPLVRTLPASKGRDLVTKSRIQSMTMFKNQNVIMFILVIIAMIAPWWVRSHYKSDVMFAAFFLGGMLFLAAFVIFINLGKRMPDKVKVPKVIVDNFKKKQVPFYDATGAHAGALLGDVLHDPFQTFIYSNVYIKKDILDKISLQPMQKIIDELFSKHKNKVIKNTQGYEAIHLPKNELFVLGETQDSVSPVEVLSCNRYDYDGKMIKLTTSENKELIVTPEHKIAVNKNGKIAYKEAKDIKINEKIVSKSEDIIIDEQDIINTYDERQQEQFRLYYKYLDIKAQNPTWGYKRIAKTMGQKIGKTRWWHAKKHIPVPVQTAKWLKKKGLLPLKIDNPHLPLIAKVLGATFGDGGIFDNLNGIFLSSKEKCNVQEFRKDVETIFSLKQEENSRIIEGGEFGHSWCYQNTNRNVIRLFMALGSPIGKKSSQEFKLPRWVYINQKLQKEFFGSIFGSEAGVPKVHNSWAQVNTFDFAITGEKGLEQNRIDLLNEIKNYLISLRVKTGKISQRVVKTKYSNKDSVLYRFLISTEFENLLKFVRNCKLNYCKYKREKLVKTINEWKQEKRKRYHNLLSRGFGAEKAMTQLNLSASALYDILNDKRFIAKEYPTT